MLVIWRVDGVEEIFVGKFGVVYFDTKIFADAGEEIGGVDGLIGIGLQFFIEAGGDVAQGGGAAGDFGGDKAEGFEQGFAAGVGMRLGGAAAGVGRARGGAAAAIRASRAMQSRTTAAGVAKAGIKAGAP